VEIERTAQVDRIDRLADSLVLDVMRGLTPATSWVSARLVSSGTRSLPALKAFLQGEGYLRQFWLDSAVASYTRAIGLDTAFALALRQLGVARGWNYLPAAEEFVARAAVFSRGLSPRDSLMVAYSSQSSGLSDPAFYRLVQRQEAILGEMIQRFPRIPSSGMRSGKSSSILASSGRIVLGIARAGRLIARSPAIRVTPSPTSTRSKSP
jgi:serine/threonine-protein kinase